MAIAKQTVGVTRGYKPRTARVAKRNRNVMQRAAVTFQHSARALFNLARAEIVYATIDTMRLVEYIQLEMKKETRVQKQPRENNAFCIEQQNVANVPTFKR